MKSKRRAKLCDAELLQLIDPEGEQIARLQNEISLLEGDLKREELRVLEEEQLCNWHQGLMEQNEFLRQQLFEYRQRLANLKDYCHDRLDEIERSGKYTNPGDSLRQDSRAEGLDRLPERVLEKPTLELSKQAWESQFREG